MLRWSSLAIFSFNILRGKKKILPLTIPWCILLVLLDFVFHILLFNSLASCIQPSCFSCVFPVFFRMGKSPRVLRCAKALSHGWLFVTPHTVARQAPLSMEFSRQEYCWLPFPTPGDLRPRDRTCISCVGRQFFTTTPLGKGLQANLLIVNKHISPCRQSAAKDKFPGQWGK